MKTSRFTRLNRLLAGASLRHGLIWLGAVLSLGANAHAGVIYSNLDGSGDYTAGAGQTIQGTSLGYDAAAAAFTPASTVALGEIAIPLTFFGSGSDTDSAVISLASDSSGLPGADIESWNVSGLPLFGSSNSVLLTVAPTSTVNLTGGVQYWVVVTPGATNTEDAWNLSDTSGTQTTAREFGSGGWGINGTPVALEVLSASAPEPSTFALLGTTLCCLGAVARFRRRRQVSE
jgi:hypothetical protein